MARKASPFLVTQDDIAALNAPTGLGFGVTGHADSTMETDTTGNITITANTPGTFDVSKTQIQLRTDVPEVRIEGELYPGESLIDYPIGKATRPWSQISLSTGVSIVQSGTPVMVIGQTNITATSASLALWRKSNANLNFGTTTAHSVTLVSNNTTRMTISSGGGFTFPNTITWGIFGATAAVQQVSGADLTNNVTAGGTDDTIADYTDLLIYSNDAAAIRNNIYQLARKLKQVNDALRVYGWLT